MALAQDTNEGASLWSPLSQRGLILVGGVVQVAAWRRGARGRRHLYVREACDGSVLDGGVGHQPAPTDGLELLNSFSWQPVKRKRKRKKKSFEQFLPAGCFRDFFAETLMTFWNQI